MSGRSVLILEGGREGYFVGEGLREVKLGSNSSTAISSSYRESWNLQKMILQQGLTNFDESYNSVFSYMHMHITILCTLLINLHLFFIKILQVTGETTPVSAGRGISVQLCVCSV